MVDNENMALQVKTDLAKMVLPETLYDIEEYLKPEFPPRKQIKKTDEQENEDEVNGRRIVMDGFGRWREIRPKKYQQSKQLAIEIEPNQLTKMKKLFRIDSSALNATEEAHHRHDSKSYSFPGLPSRYNVQYHSGMDRLSGQSSRHANSLQLKCQNTPEDNFMYNSLGMTTRSNVFPGIGNIQWHSTTSRTFTKKPMTAVENREKFFGIQSDDFGAWSAANVLNERMKRAWQDYLASAPKPTANRNPPVQRTTQHVMPKQPTLPKPKARKNTPKNKPKMESITEVHSPLQEPDQPSEPQAPPPYIPVDVEDDDENFWEFYDNPFNKPKK